MRRMKSKIIQICFSTRFVTKDFTKGFFKVVLLRVITMILEIKISHENVKGGFQPSFLCKSECNLNY